MIRTFARTIFWALMNLWYSKTRWRGSRLEPSVQWRGHGLRGMGPNCYIGSGTVIDGNYDSDVQIGTRTWIGAGCELSGGHLLVGPHCSFQHRSQLHGNLRIGAGLVGASGLYIASGSHEFRWKPSLSIKLQDRAFTLGVKNRNDIPVEIGEDCWLGLNVVVMPGVSIGRGCVVGANSVVTRDLPPYSVAAGAPARVVSKRLHFDPPSVIYAASDSHMPYFYEGFDQWSTSENEVGPTRIDGGLLVIANRFLILLEPAENVELRFVATRPLSLKHGSRTFDVTEGLSVLVWPMFPDSRGRLCFSLTSRDDRPLPLSGFDHGLRVIQARRMPDRADR